MSLEIVTEPADPTIRLDPCTFPVTYVLIVSNFCNLRCRYCYEYPHLGNKHRMSLEEIRAVFERIAHFHVSSPATIQFAWQGGEPLLHEPEYFRRALAVQREVFGGVPIRNVLQTNLTRVDEERIALLAECFDGVGVSYDVVGDLRVNVAGNHPREKMLLNLNRLIEARIKIGGITVLNKKNIDHVASIYEFWRARRLPFRLLPVHRGPFPSLDEVGVSPDEVANAFAKCVDLWMQDGEGAVAVAPVTDMITEIVGSRSGLRQVGEYDKAQRESVLIIDPRGFLGGVNDLLDLEHAWGNVFTQSLREILSGEKHRAAAREASEKVRQSCARCPFFKSVCSGHPIAESGHELYRRDEHGAIVCTIVRRTYEHIERRLQEIGFSAES